MLYLVVLLVVKFLDSEDFVNEQGFFDGVVLLVEGVVRRGVEVVE